MITLRPRRRVAAAVLSVSAVLAATAATAPTTTAAATTSAAVRTAAARSAAAPACPQFADKTEAAADRRVDVDRITPEPAWRTTCGTLWRNDNRAPAAIFDEGFQPRDVLEGQYDIEQYVLVNQPSPYVSTTYDHDLYKTWKSAYNYYIDAPGGVDVNKTIGTTHKWADQVEVAFPGGIARRYVIGACPVDKATKTEILSRCESNPHYEPWH